MTTDDRTPEQVQADNLDHFMERGPALSYAYGTYVIARRPSTGEVLLGGLGGMGVGRMWFAESDDLKDRPGYADAEIVT